MKKINIDLSRFRKEEKKTEEWREVAREVSEYYHYKMYGIIAPWREQLWYVRDAFKKSQGKPKEYFISFLKLKKTP